MFLNENLAVGNVGIDAGDADERVAVEGLAEALHIAQLHRQIGFFRQTAGKILHHLYRLVAAHFGDFRFYESGKVGQDAQVCLNDRLDVGTLDFHGHGFAVRQDGLVHLCDGRAADGDGIERTEHFPHWPAEVGFD